MRNSVRIIRTAEAFSWPALSHAVAVGDLLLVSGQVGIVSGTAGIPDRLQTEIETRHRVLGPRPARTTVQVTPATGCASKIDAIAASDH